MKKFVAGSVLAALVAISQAGAGITYTSVTKTEGQAGGPQPGLDMTVKGTVQGPMMKLEYTETTNPMMPTGSYMLTKDAGKVMYLVNPAKKTYMEWDIEKMMATAGAAMQMAKSMMTMKFSDPKIEKVLDENGPSILGYPTRHCKFITAYSMDMSMMGMKMTTSIKQEEETWSTEKLLDEGFKAWEKSAISMKTGDEQFDKLIAAQKPKLTGFPLKTISINTTTDHTGKEQVTRTVTEITEMQNATVPASSFEIPESFTKEEMKMPSLDAGTKAGSGAEGAEAANALINIFGNKK